MTWCTDDRDTFTQKYEEFIKNNDFNGAADYLESFNVPQERLSAVRAQIRSLRDTAMQYKSAVTNANGNEDLINFYHNHKNGNSLDPETNSVAKEYCDAYNAIGGKDNNLLRVTFEGTKHKRHGLFGLDFLAKDIDGLDNAFDLFKNQLGLSKDEVQANFELGRMGVNKGYNKDGSMYIEFTKDNRETVEAIFKALESTDTNHTIKLGDMPINSDSKGERRWSIEGVNDLDARIKELENFTGEELVDKSTTYPDRRTLDQKVVANSRLRGFLSDDAKVILDRLDDPLMKGHTSISTTIEPISGAFGSSEYNALPFSQKIKYLTKLRDLKNLRNKNSEMEVFHGSAINEGPIINPFEDEEEQLQKVLNIVDNSKKAYEHALGLADEDGNPYPITQSVERLGIPTAYIQDIRDKYGRGALTKEQYNTFIDVGEKSIMNHILSANYHNFECFGSNPQAEDEAKSVMHKLSDTEAYDIRDIINKANNDDQQIVYEMARMGDRIGMWIGVGGKYKEGSDKEDKNYITPVFREFFITDFTKDASNADRDFYTDSRTLASVDMGKLQRYRMPLDVSLEPGTSEWIEPIIGEDGVPINNEVRYWKQNGKNPATYEDIDLATAERLRHKKIIADNGIDSLLRSMYNSDGEYVGNANLDALTERLVNSAMLDLYNSDIQQMAVNKAAGLNIEKQQEDLERKKDALLNYIKRSIQLKIEL